MAKILETNLCRINYSDSLEELSNATVKLLQNKIVEYKKLFNIEFDEQIIVNYFDDLEEFREFIYKIRGERICRIVDLQEKINGLDIVQQQ